jgi:Universal stress protein family
LHNILYIFHEVKRQSVSKRGRVKAGAKKVDKSGWVGFSKDFCRVEYGDVVMLGGRPFLIRHNAKDLRFGLDDEPKFWVKNAIDLEDGSKKIIAAGFDPSRVEVRSPLRYCPSLAECILAEREKSKYHTIVVGRQGLSRKERFLFGSVSSKIVNHAGNCTVWVVS